MGNSSSEVAFYNYYGEQRFGSNNEGLDRVRVVAAEHCAGKQEEAFEKNYVFSNHKPFDAQVFQSFLFNVALKSLSSSKADLHMRSFTAAPDADVESDTAPFTFLPKKLPLLP